MEVYESYYDEDLDESLSEVYEDYEEDYDEGYLEDYDEADDGYGEANRRRGGKGRRGNRTAGTRNAGRAGRAGRGGRGGQRRGQRAGRAGNKPVPSPARPATVGAVKDAMDKAGDVIDGLKKQAKILEDDKWINLIATFAFRPKLETQKIVAIEMENDGKTPKKTGDEYVLRALDVGVTFKDNLLPQSIVAGLIAIRGKYGIPRSAPMLAIILFALLPDLLNKLTQQGGGEIALNNQSLNLNTNSVLASAAAGFMIFKGMKK